MDGSLKFYVNAILKQVTLKNILARDDDFNIIDIDNNVYVPTQPQSASPLTLPGSIWFKVEDSDTLQMYYGDLLICRIDRSSGNLKFGAGDFSILDAAHGGTGVDSLEDLFTALGLTDVATSDAGTGIGDILRFTVANQLPALDGSLLTNLPTIPVGQISYFAMSDAPAGFIKANGALLLRSTYATLFDKIGITYGAGDGSTTFRAPDVRGLFIRGWDDARGIDAGRTFGSEQTDAFKQHGHKNKYSSSYTGFGNLGSGWQSNFTTGLSNATSSENFVTDSDDATAGSETRPKNIALLACIKY